MLVSSSFPDDERAPAYSDPPFFTPPTINPENVADAAAFISSVSTCE